MSKNGRVFQYIKGGGSITKLMAIRMFGLINLGNVIHRFRSRGYAIVTEMVKSPKGESYAVYYLPEAERVRLSLREAGQ